MCWPGTPHGIDVLLFQDGSADLSSSAVEISNKVTLGCNCFCSKCLAFRIPVIFIQATDLKACRQLASQITSKGAKLYELLRQEVALRVSHGLCVMLNKT